MINLYQEITQFDGVNFHDHLKRIGAFDIFEQILNSSEFNDNTEQIKVCQYVVYTHSMESPKIYVGGDRRKMLSSVFKSLSLDDKLYQPLVCLENFDVISVVKKWMDKQDDKQLQFLFTLQNAFVQQQTASLAMLPKSSGGVDYDQKMRCIEHMVELKKMIKDAESELQQNDPKLKQAYEEVKMAGKRSSTLSVEDFVSISIKS